jgi:hypothetical protein
VGVAVGVGLGGGVPRTNAVNFCKIVGPDAVIMKPTATAPHRSFTVTLIMN